MALLTVVTLTRLLAVPQASGRTYYVATTGRNSNPGSLSLPFATINRGVSILQPGDTLYLRGGTYLQTVTIENSGNAGAPITVAGYPGERAVIDGQDTIPGYWGALVTVHGNDVVIRNVEVSNSAWIGVGLYGRHNSALTVYAHHNMENGILLGGDYGLVENSRLWWNAKAHEYGDFKTGHGPTWSTGLSAARHPQHATLRSNTVWNTWGEGLSTFEAEHTTLEDNVVYDNWINVYLSDTKYAIVRRNLIYCSASSPMAGSGAGEVGILIGDETRHPASSDNQFANNFVKGCNGNFRSEGKGPGVGLVNNLIAFNTFSSSSGPRPNFQIDGGVHSDTRVVNNIIDQTDNVPIAIVQTPVGLTFANNLWSRNPSANGSGPGDVVGDPGLARTGDTSAGALSPTWFTLLDLSPARHRAVVLPTIDEDFFRMPRSESPDIGGSEYAAIRRRIF
jgi:hypothetical protein